MSKARNTRRRRMLHMSQQGQCHYCPAKIDVLLESTRGSVLEHFIPESAGGTFSQTVLACVPCDKAKGMIPGPEFMKIVSSVWSPLEPFTMAMRMEISRLCKIRNRELQNAHPARVIGEANAKARQELRMKIIQGRLLSEGEPAI